ncbi:MAG TPA: hypothetical protein VGR73_08640 [Bryobacteraceae bacterium]|nr:hypothetical protein [Bryobacteraceae bacterium]
MSQIQIEIIVLALAAAGLIALAVWIAVRRNATPEKRERRRRLQIHATGRLGDAVVTEVGDDLLYYSYTIRGVQYTASQDIAALRDRLPADLSRLVGPSQLKYVPKNPANSILLCEEWSGLRAPAGVASSDQRTVTL